MKILLCLALISLSFTTFAENNESKFAAHVPERVQTVGNHILRGSDTFADSDFESTFPPAGWTHVQTNVTETWFAETGFPISGTTSASVVYDPFLAPADEWLITPEFYAVSGTVDVTHNGSIYWCRDDFDNCDLDVYLIVDGVGGGDDILIKNLDEDWIDSYITNISTQIDFTSSIPNSNTPLQIGFRYTGVDGAQVSMDDVLVSGVAGSAVVAEPQSVPSLQWYSIFALLLMVGFLSRRKFQ